MVTGSESGWRAFSSRARSKGSSLSQWLVDNGLKKAIPSDAEMRERAIAFQKQHGRLPSSGKTEGGWKQFSKKLLAAGSSLQQWCERNGMSTNGKENS